MKVWVYEHKDGGEKSIMTEELKELNPFWFFIGTGEFDIIPPKKIVRKEVVCDIYNVVDDNILIYYAIRFGIPTKISINAER